MTLRTLFPIIIARLLKKPLYHNPVGYLLKKIGVTAAA
ncbi:MAG: hypothetical protein ACJAVR_001422 [Paracoccaceae bacterium]|jgi:hypothetical protein